LLNIELVHSNAGSLQPFPQLPLLLLRLLRLLMLAAVSSSVAPADVTRSPQGDPADVNNFMGKTAPQTSRTAIILLDLRSVN